MKISIALATYNGEEYLQEQLNSILTQTRLPDELIVSDDASIDSTLEILNYYREIATFKINILSHKNNIGYKKNFERAINHTTGDIIFLSDQDDMWFENKIKTHIEIYKKNKSVLTVINDQELTNLTLNPTGIQKIKLVKKYHSLDSFVTGCCTSFRSSLKPYILPIPEICNSHDNWIHKMSLALDSRIVLEEPLQYYRRHNSNTSNWTEDQKVEFRTFLKKMLSRSESDYSLHVNILNEIRTRFVSKKVCQKYIKNLDNNISFWKQRNGLKNDSRFIRYVKIFLMLFKGYYLREKGMRKLIKDILL